MLVYCSINYQHTFYSIDLTVVPLVTRVDWYKNCVVMEFVRDVWILSLSNLVYLEKILQSIYQASFNHEKVSVMPFFRTKTLIFLCLIC